MRWIFLFRYSEKGGEAYQTGGMPKLLVGYSVPLRYLKGSFHDYGQVFSKRPPALVISY